MTDYFAEQARHAPENVYTPELRQEIREAVLDVIEKAGRP